MTTRYTISRLSTHHDGPSSLLFIACLACIDFLHRPCPHILIIHIMPTDDDTLLPPLVRASSLRSAHATCPPEIDSTVTATFDVNSSRGNANSIDPSRAEQDPLPVPGEEQPPSSGATEHRRPPAQAHTARGHDGGSAIQRDSPSPMDVIDHTRDDPAMRAHPAGSVPKLATPFPTPLRGPEASSRVRRLQNDCQTPGRDGANCLA